MSLEPLSIQSSTVDTFGESSPGVNNLFLLFKYLSNLAFLSDRTWTIHYKLARECMNILGKINQKYGKYKNIRADEFTGYLPTRIKGEIEFKSKIKVFLSFGVLKALANNQTSVAIATSLLLFPLFPKLK